MNKVIAIFMQERSTDTGPGTGPVIGTCLPHMMHVRTLYNTILTQDSYIVYTLLMSVRLSNDRK